MLKPFVGIALMIAESTEVLNSYNAHFKLNISDSVSENEGLWIDRPDGIRNGKLYKGLACCIGQLVVSYVLVMKSLLTG